MEEKKDLLNNLKIDRDSHVDKEPLRINKFSIFALSNVAYTKLAPSKLAPLRSYPLKSAPS